MHHIYTEFSLTSKGLDLAQSISASEVDGLLSLATEFGGLE
jgi:hypothetical protein